MKRPIKIDHRKVRALRKEATYAFRKGEGKAKASQILRELRDFVFGKGSLLEECSLEEIYASIRQFDSLSEWYDEMIRIQVSEWENLTEALAIRDGVKPTLKAKQAVHDFIAGQAGEVTKRFRNFRLRHEGYRKEIGS